MGFKDFNYNILSSLTLDLNLADLSKIYTLVFAKDACHHNSDHGVKCRKSFLYNFEYWKATNADVIHDV